MRLRDLFLPKEKPQEQQFNEELADFVNKEYQKRQTERLPFELQWRLNTEFLNSNQYLDINPVTNTIEDVPRQYWYQEREVFNQISTIIEVRISRLTRQKPMLKVRPSSGDEKDVASAKVSSMLLASSWHDQEMDSAYNDFVTWLEVHGTVFLKPIWDKNAGKTLDIQVQQNQEALEGEEITETDKQLGAGYAVEQIKEGEIDTSIVPAHEFFPDSSYRSTLKQCRSVIHARAYHVDEIDEIWGVKVEEEKVDVTTLQRSSSAGGLGYTGSGFKTAVQKLEKHAVVKEYYELPSKKYPQGRFIVVAGDKTLHVGAMPYMIGEDGEVTFPFVRTVSIHSPGCFWGKSVIERCIPIQRRYNALRNRKAEYLNMVTIGQWYEAEGSIDDDVELNNAPGNRVTYKQGMDKPSPVEFPSLPSSFENEVQTLMSEFTAISGVSELSRFSEAPSGVKSGVALSIATEQDDTRIGLTASRIANSITILGKYWLRLYRQFVQEPRVLRTVGSSRDVEVRMWTASDLSSDDVFIENSAALSETPAQRRQMVFELMKAGLFNRPETSPFTEDVRRKIFQLLEFGHWEYGADDDEELQKQRAKREGRDMMEGKPSQVRDFDDHAIHIQTHNRLRMSSEYENLIKTPMVGEMIDMMMQQHIEQHVTILMQEQAMMAPPPEENEEQEEENKQG